MTLVSDFGLKGIAKFERLPYIHMNLILIYFICLDSSKSFLSKKISLVEIYNFV